MVGKYKTKIVNIVGPQGVGKTTIWNLVEKDLIEHGINCVTINCTGYGTSPTPLRQLGRITDYAIMAMDRTGRVFPFLAIAGLNSTLLYNIAKYFAITKDPDLVLIQRNPYLDTYAMGEAVLRRTFPKRLTRFFSKMLTYESPDLLIHLDAEPEVLYERILQRIEEAPTSTDKQKPHLYENITQLERIRRGYFDVIDTQFDGERILRLDTSNLTIQEVFDAVKSRIYKLFETDM